jgi:PAS domain-containing protein
VRRALESGEPFDFHERIVRPGGEVRILHSQGEVVHDTDGRPLRLFGVCQDVTTQLNAEEQVRRGEQAAVTRRVLSGLAELLPALTGALDLARELLVAAPAAHEGGPHRELVARLEDAHAAIAELTGGRGNLLPRAR